MPSGSRIGPAGSAPLVRRASGGGAILHDAEITYSLAIPHAHALADDTTWLYTAVHEALVEVLYAQGLEAIAVRQGAAAAASTAAEQPFLCFQRRAVGDVLLGEAKICGSAQRRRRGAILQHGSLIFERSRAGPRAAGPDRTGRAKIDRACLSSGGPPAIGRKLNWNFCRPVWIRLLKDAVRTLALEKYSAQSWTCRR